MKYNTFRNTLLAGGALALVGGFLYATTFKPAPKVTVSSPVVSVPDTLPVNSEKAPQTTAGNIGARTAGADVPTSRPLVAPPEVSKQQASGKIKTPLRELDRELLKIATQAQAAKASKGKDVFPDRPYKVNLYVEEGRVVRAKVDLNRNNKWDEKWSFEPDGDIKRQVSPEDDDTNYTLNYKVAGDSWVQK